VGKLGQPDAKRVFDGREIWADLVPGSLVEAIRFGSQYLPGKVVKGGAERFRFEAVVMGLAGGLWFEILDGAS